MPAKNKYIPNEQLSSRERIERKAKSFGNNPFTLKDINKLLKPRMKLDAIRFHIENLVNNLYVTKLPRVGREDQLYVWGDVLKTIENESILNGAAHSFITDLYSMAIHLREGHIITPEQLVKTRSELRNLAAELEAEVHDLWQLHDCVDLWNPRTLVERLGFIDREGK